MTKESERLIRVLEPTHDLYELAEYLKGVQDEGPQEAIDEAYRMARDALRDFLIGLVDET